MKKEKLTKQELAKLRPVEELELVPLEFEQLLVHPYEGTTTAILSAADKKFAYSLTPVEGTALVFEKYDLAKNAHIKNIYQMYVQMMLDINIRLENVVFESIHGDVMYCKLQWCTSKHRRFYMTCSVGDALVLGTMTKAPMHIVRKTLDKLESCNDWIYENDIWDEEF